MNEQSVLATPLGGACDLAAASEEIRLLVPGKAFAWLRGEGGRGKVGLEPEFFEGHLNPSMHAAVAFGGGELVPFMAARKYQAVSPVRIVRHNAAPGRPPH